MSRITNIINDKNVGGSSSGMIGTSLEYVTYYNLAIYPYFRLKDGWHGGSRIAYYSRINQENASLGDAAIAEMTMIWQNKRIIISQNCHESMRSNAPYAHT